MAKLKTQGFDIEISYESINEWGEIVYGLNLLWDGHPFINPAIRSKEHDKANKILVNDCFNEDWVLKNFIEILDSNSNKTFGTIENPEILFKTKVLGNDIDIEITFPHNYFIRNQNAGIFSISTRTSLKLFKRFVETLQNESKLFFEAHVDKVQLSDNYEYEVLKFN